MKKAKQMDELTKLTRLKFQKAAQEYIVVNNQDLRLAAEFKQLQNSLIEHYSSEVPLNEASPHETNKAKWQEWVIGQQIHLNQKRIATKIALDEKQKKLAFAAGQQRVSEKLATKLKTEAAKRLAERDQ